MTTAALRSHWPEYASEALCLGLFMISAGLVGTLLEAPGSPLRAALPDATSRRVIAGLAMGLTAIALIYSPLGKRSGAHMNPATTLTFLRLGKISRVDAAGYALAQLVGGVCGVLLVAALFGSDFREAPVRWVSTLPGDGGAGVAFLAELAISFGMMSVVLVATNHARLAPYTGLLSGLLVATYISLEAPISGMSMNPARTLASALPAGLFQHLWIYLLAPPLGMLLAAQVYVRLAGRARVQCAKLQHDPHYRCIFCGHEPVSPPSSRGAR